MDSFLVGLIGSGIGPSLSPALHEQEAAHHGVHYVYRLLDVDRLGGDVGELVRTARRFGYDGLNVTHPCKQAVIPYLDELSPDARMLGAVNTVVFDGERAVGHNTDWTGFAESFARGLPDAPAHQVVQLGAGGAGSAVAHALLTMGADRITVVDSDPARARALTGELAARFGTERARHAVTAELPELLAKAEGLVHATPTGMAHHPGLPLPAELLHPGLWVADIVYRPLETELLRHARAAGCRTLDGAGMVVFQAVQSFRLFTGREPDTDRMLAHLTDLIAV
ncbi:shikimate dehydrogenase [Nonomuraea sp. KC401]|uniref:shikimate dehydrogenase n=1 Tax=unclassified Nonomuraea TaxID=2593643 RepID=UPI0010FE1C3F|nr:MULTISPECIES: shikimate dehydrogenase [unclassified Nonomuraea]NBE97945.1 shikimate dehydrogenase [Nonomuraea sp. K271]TLF61960.1 shikimate dehydrogenase [Nonomuraea sp. KC401]